MALAASIPAPLPNSMNVDLNLAAFAQVTQGLIHHGAIPVLHYLNDLVHLHPVASTSSGPPPRQPVATQDVEPTLPKAVARIHQACQQTFGTTEPLKFDFEEDALTHGKRCTLTITRPDGATRTYESSILYGRKYDAKASVCTLAISDGAIDFIFDEPTVKPSSSAAALEHSSVPLDMDDSVKAIEQCCLEWAGGHVKPFWLNISEPKFGKTHGCVLRIRLERRKSRTYSVNTIYDSTAEARKACAEAALADGVIQFIRSWTHSEDDMDVVEETDSFSAIGLQQFFDSLPKPFPEPVAGRSAADINGPAWLNTTIQSSRGAKLVPNFVWIADARHNLHGCLLRLERPGEVRSYLVEARFMKRMEAKAAVCLLAMSEGVGDYIRDVGRAVKDKLSPATRKHVSEVLQPLLNAEYRKVRGPGIQPSIEYDQDMDACGATMVIELVPNPGPQQVRRYTVPAEYCNRNDARLAVIHDAIQEGVIDFLRLQGKPQPPGYVPYVPYAPQQEQQFVNRKRKTWDTGNNGGYSNGGGPRGGGDWSNHNDFGPPPAGGSSNGGWQNKKRRTGGAFQGGGSGLDSGHSFGSPQTQSYRHSGPRGSGSYQQGDIQSGWRGEQGPHGQPRGQDRKWNQPDVSRPPRGGFGGQFKAGLKSGFAGPSGFVPRQQPIPVPYPPPTVQYPTFPMSSQQQSHPSPPSYPYPSGGTVPGNAQSTQAASSSAVPYAQHIPIPYQTSPPQPPVTPYGVPSAPPGGIIYPPYVAPPAGLPPSFQYPPQQYPYDVGRPSVPSNGQAAGYQHYFPPSQPQLPVQPIVPPAPPAPAPPAIGFPTFPYPNFPPAPPADPTYQPSFGQSQAQPPPPLPQQLHQQPPLPVPLTVQPPPPPPPSVSPPPAPASPQISTVTPRPLQPQQTPPAKPASADNPLSPKSTIPKNSGIVVSIPTTPKTNVQALYDYCNEHGMPTPQWGQELLSSGVRKHKVWVVIGKMKFEIPVLFSSLSQAQERVAGKVVSQFKAQGHAEAPKTVASEV